MQYKIQNKDKLHEPFKQEDEPKFSSIYIMPKIFFFRGGGGSYRFFIIGMVQYHSTLILTNIPKSNNFNDNYYVQDEKITITQKETTTPPQKTGKNEYYPYNMQVNCNHTYCEFLKVIFFGTKSGVGAIMESMEFYFEIHEHHNDLKIWRFKQFV